ncbi:MAG: hypothetical protein KGJ60_15365, partial [Verrucomicrobiota bacterium]|nr:hypothetical protein [Verrucomicrobiota bacterium]
AVGLVARQNGQVARATHFSTAWLRLRQVEAKGAAYSEFSVFQMKMIICAPEALFLPLEKDICRSGNDRFRPVDDAFHSEDGVRQPEDDLGTPEDDKRRLEDGIGTLEDGVVEPANDVGGRQDAEVIP